MEQERDTICAPATAAGKAAIAIVRVSGPRAHEAVAALTGGRIDADRRLRLRHLRDPDTGETLDEALVVAFPAGASPTGEPAAEAHVHGGGAVVAAVMRALTAQPSVRLAQPGEFSRRALENGRLDLTQIEGIADLIDAETEAQRRQATRLLQGGLSAAVARWRGGLIEARAFLEAAIDFADEDDIPAEAVREGLARLAPIAGELEAAVAGAAGAALVRSGFEVALIGPPNAGKSSLLNRIAGRDVALTSSIPGTTRDALEVRCAIGSHLVTVIDTAGQRETPDPLEALGVERAQRRADAADLRVVVRAHDAQDAPRHRAGDVLVWNKSDVARGEGLAISAATGEGVDDLLAVIGEVLAQRTAEDGLLSRSRHATCVATALRHVQTALDAAPEIAAEELRLACESLDVLIGRIDPERVLDEIFSRFCLGK
jgi:tRNA modification GTPase